MIHTRQIRTTLCMAFLSLPTLLFTVTTVHAADHTWNGSVDNDFFNPANWDGGAPVGDEELAVINGGPNTPVVISVDGGGSIPLGGFQLGTDGDTGGDVIHNSGTLIISGTNLSGATTSREFKSHIGDQGTRGSSWIMNNDATILYDGPLDGDGLGYGTDGINSYDLEIGAQVGAGAVGLLELHDNAVLRISDDLKIGAEDLGNGIVVADGNAQITVGSGISLGENAEGRGQLRIGGNALVVTGNSAGPGNAIDGRTNEGYLTLSVDDTGVAELSITDDARLYARTLQQRLGETTIDLSGNGQLHIFDVFEFETPSLGTTTVKGSIGTSERTSHLSSGIGSTTTIRIRDNAQMTIDSDIPDSTWSGLAVSGGTNTGGNTGGGSTLIDVADFGSFIVGQDLNMTLGTDIEATSTLQVKGPNATVQIVGDLRMALDPDGGENPGKANLQAILTSGSHTTIQVGGSVNIDRASLAVSFDGYEPIGGEQYTLISAGSITGEVFANFELPDLREGLEWNFNILGNDAILAIMGGDGVQGDYNADGMLTAADTDLLNQGIVSGGNDAQFDINGDGTVDLSDQSAWLSLAATANGFSAPYLPGDTNLDGTVDAADLNAVGLSWLANVSTWSGGDLNADGQVNASDLNLLGINWQKSIPAATQAVPEPSGLMSLLLALWGFGLVRRTT